MNDPILGWAKHSWAREVGIQAQNLTRESTRPKCPERNPNPKKGMEWGSERWTLDTPKPFSPVPRLLLHSLLWVLFIFPSIVLQFLLIILTNHLLSVWLLRKHIKIRENKRKDLEISNLIVLCFCCCYYLLIEEGIKGPGMQLC